MMKTYGYIYKTINTKNNRIYIGQRKGGFNPNYFGSGLIIKQAIKKYGIIHFKIEFIKTANSKQELDELEKYYITEAKKLFGDNLYNIAKGGQGGAFHNINPWLNKKHSEETKRKISSAQKGKTISLFSRYKMSIAKKGKHLSEATKIKMGNHPSNFKGKHHTETTKEILRKKHLGRIGYWDGKHHSEETKNKISNSHKGLIPWNKGLTYNKGV